MQNELMMGSEVMNFVSGDRIVYRRYAAMKYENEFHGEILALNNGLAKVRLKNRAGKEIIKTVAVTSLDRAPDQDNGKT